MMLSKCWALTMRAGGLGGLSTASEADLKIRSSAKDRETPVKLEMLPIELLVQIADCLRPSRVEEHTVCNLRDLYSICLALRTLNAVATPFLYQAFSTQDSAASIRPFVRTIIQNPGLARFVRNINIRRWRAPTMTAPTQGELISFLEAALPLLDDGKYHSIVSTALKAGDYEA